MGRLKTSLIAAGLLVSANMLIAEGAGFASALKAEDHEAAGLTKLSDAQIAALDNLVEREKRLARQGGTPAFASEFSKRRSAPERAKAGIDTLSQEERAKLDSLVAQALAEQPPQIFEQSPTFQSNAVRGVKPKPIVHGHVSFTVGSSGNGRNFYGGSVYVEQVDPQKGYSIGIGYSEFRGKGLWYDDWGYYGYGSGYGRYGHAFDPLAPILGYPYWRTRY